MNPFLSFLGAIFPDLLSYVRELFDASGGDVEVARKDIQDRSKDIAERRKKRDRQLEDKYASRD